VNPGDLILAEDRTGKGHTSQPVTDEWLCLFVHLED
jgi:hypothetical protein